jgi:hypothetical protein
MTALTLNVTEDVKAFAPSPDIKKMIPADPIVVLERSPCYWTITRTGEGTIIARSRRGDEFEGTTEDFNALLRG